MLYEMPWCAPDGVPRQRVALGPMSASKSDAQTFLVRLAWAPNTPVPLDVSYEMEGRGERLPAEWFEHAAMCARFDAGEITMALGRGRHFWDEALSASCESAAVEPGQYLP